MFYLETSRFFGGDNYKKSQKKHFLKGVVSKIAGYRVSHKSDSNAFFSGTLEHVREVLKSKPKDKSRRKKKSFQ
jgi:hypothetical protein